MQRDLSFCLSRPLALTRACGLATLLVLATLFTALLTLAGTAGRAHAAAAAAALATSVEQGGVLTLSLSLPTAQPSHFTTLPYLDLAGSAAGPDGIAGVQVTPAHGTPVQARLSRSADGQRARWQSRRLFLRPGLNTLQIRALDKTGRQTLRYLTVMRAAPGDGVAAAEAASAGTVLFGQRAVPYRAAGGRAIVEGDIDVGPVPSGPTSAPTSWPGSAAGASTTQPDAFGVATPGQLWAKVGGVAQIPYTTSSGNANVAPAIAQFNATFSGSVQWVARGAQADYVDFDLDPGNHNGSAASWVGRKGGPQQISGSVDADLGTLLHEMGHTVGLLHEQSRADRDAYVKLLDANIIKSLKDNFDISQENSQALGLYDYASVMHYRPFTFSKNGEPTLESIPAGIPMSELGGYSAGDIDAVLRLDQLAPSAVTITSNPPGLQVVVDGNTITTPQTFNFAIGSSHTVDVPTAPQASGGKNYVYGRWGDNSQRSHTISIAKGNGLVGSPVTKPAVTVYSAHFVELVPYAPFVSPSGAGSVTATPTALSYPPLAGSYYVARQPVTLQANPAAGYSLYRLYTAYGPVSQSPKVTRNPDWVLAYFTPQQKTTIGSNPAGRWLWVDGQFYEGPVAFSPYYPADGNWAVGTVHSIDVGVNLQLPYSYSIRYPWTTWSDGGAMLHNLAVPSGNSTVTANFGQQFYAATWAQQPCAGSVATSPFSADGFYNSGASVSYSQTPTAGWTFTGWLGDFTGSTNPKTLTMTDERLMVANYNALAAPVAITSLTPASKVAGQAAFSLKIAGTGFNAGSGVYIGGVYRAPQKVTAKQITVKLTAADIAVPGAVQVFVQTFPAGAGCAAYAARSLQVRSSGTQPLAVVAPRSLSFASLAVGATSAPQNLTLDNTGNTPLALHDVVLAGANPGDFALVSSCGSAVAAAAQCSVAVRFKPGASGKRSATVMWVDSAFDSPQSAAVSGTATP